MFHKDDLIKGLADKTALLHQKLKGESDYQKIQSICLEYGLYIERLQEFQQQNKISGLQKRSIKVGDSVLDFHESHYQLMTLDSDLAVLQSEKDKIIDFFLEVDSDEFVNLSGVFIANHNETEYIYISEWMVKQVCKNADFAKLSYTFTGNGSDYQPTLKLMVGWGKPENSVYFKDTGEIKMFFRFKGDDDQQ